MAKKKTNQQKQAPVSPEKYMRTRVRNLPIEQCYINPNWQEAGITYVMVIRRHPQGTHSYGLILVDTWCRGVVDCFYGVNVDDDRIDDILNHFASVGLEETDYATAHNIVYGALAFAEDAGIEPHRSFDVAQYILEEDTDDIPFIELEFGHNGRYCLCMPDADKAKFYLKLLDKNVGHGNYDCILDMPQPVGKYNEGVTGKYGYLMGERPNADISSVRNKDLMSVLTCDISTLKTEQVRRIMDIDADELRADLHTVVTATIHDTWRAIENDDDSIEQLSYEVIPNAMVFLAEVADDSSADVVFELFRQSDRFLEFYFGDSQVDFMSPVLYKLFVADFTRFYGFMTERGPSGLAKSAMIEALTNQVMVYAPERATDLMRLYADIFDYYIAHKTDEYLWDGSLVGLIICMAIDCGFTGLLPKIAEIYSTGYVDESVAGTLSQIEESIVSRNPEDISAYPNDVYGWIEEFKRRWGR